MTPPPLFSAPWPCDPTCTDILLLPLTALALGMLTFPQDQLPADPDARKSWQWSKAKKWVMHIASRLFNR